VRRNGGKGMMVAYF